MYSKLCICKLLTTPKSEPCGYKEKPGSKFVSEQRGQGTVKAPNFGPHGNFGPLFQKGLLSLKRVLQKNEENKS